MSISQLPMLISPFTLGFNIDLAYGIGLPGGDKMQRIQKEADTIMRTEDHWFNEPIRLPPAFKDVYQRMQRESNAKLEASGQPFEKDWVRFDGSPSENEVLNHAYPITKFLHRKDKPEAQG